jgi:hypothetical protein
MVEKLVEIWSEQVESLESEDIETVGFTYG